MLPENESLSHVEARGLRSPAFAAVLLGICLCLAVISAEMIAAVPNWLVVSVAFATLACSSAVAFRLSRKQGLNPWTDATAALSFFYVAFFGVGMLTLYFWDLLLVEVFPRIAPHFESYQAILPNVARLTLLAGAALVLGTLLQVEGLVRILPRFRWRFDAETFYHRSFFYLPVAIICIGLTTFAPESVPGPVFHLTKLLGELSYIFLIIFAYQFTRSDFKDRRWGVLYLAFALPLAIRGIALGMRGVMIIPLFIAGFGYVMARGKLPWKLVAAASVPTVILLIPWATFLKQSHPYEVGMKSAVSAATLRFQRTSTKERVAIGLWSTVRRFAAPGNLAPCVKKVPQQFPHQRGKVLLTALQSLPPRAVWPEKPNVSAKLNYYSRELGVIGQDDKKTSAVFNALGLYYLDFGAMGIFLLCIAHGLAIRLLRNWSVGRCNYQWGAAMFLLVTLSHPDMHDVVIWSSGVIRQVVVSLPLVYLLSNAGLRLRD